MVDPMILLVRAGYAMRLPSGWREVVLEPPVAGGNEGSFITEGHLVRIDRVMSSVIPVTALMGTLSYQSRRAFDGYEPSDGREIIVVGAYRARTRHTVVEDPGLSDIMAELFVEGMDGNMWYVRISGPRYVFDGELSDRIIDSFQVLIPSSPPATSVGGPQ